jgi:hypothetical protein
MGEHCRMRVWKKLKVRLNVVILCVKHVLGGGRERARQMGRVRGPSQRFLRAFWRSTSDPTRRRGTLAHQPPPPRLQSPSNIHHARSYRMHCVFLEFTVLSIILRALWAGGARSDWGEGGHTLTPSPRAEITTNTPIRALQHV